jgi:hypothetical protein
MIGKISCGFVHLHLSDQVNATDLVWYCGTIIFYIFYVFLLFLFINMKNKILKIKNILFQHIFEYKKN